MQVSWPQVDNTLDATFTPEGRECYRLIVERLPGKNV
jgi:hypothetical protein